MYFSNLLQKEILNRIKCKVVAIDIRGHGDTHTSDDENLSIDVMTRQVLLQ